MSGTTTLSMTQRMDEHGQPLSGGKFYTIVAGTVSTPQSVYQDSALTLPWPNPITLDATGYIPQHFCADGVIKIRLTSETGVVQLVADNVAVIGSSSGGGGGGAIDPTTIYQTGDLKPRYGTGVHTGWVRGNGRTIGNSLSGATELASDADAVALYEYLWNVDPNFLSVSGGRGASAAADFTAGKQLTLPDFRGYALGFLDDMGNSAAGRITSNTMPAGWPILLGAAWGFETTGLSIAQMPAHAHSGTTDSENVGHSHTGGSLFDAAGTNNFTITGGGATALVTAVNATGGGNTDGVSNGHTHAFSTSSIGGGAAHANLQPTMLVTVYLKL